jgi:hypothetical protein
VILLLLHDCSVEVVQVGPANRAECQQRILDAIGQRLFRELPEFDTRLQHDLNDGSEHRLRSLDNIRRGKEPHSVDEPDKALLIATQRDFVAGISVQEQARRAHQKISINGFSFRDLRRDALNAALRALRVNGPKQRGTTSYEGPQEQTKRAQESWLNVHVAPKRCS